MIRYEKALEEIAAAIEPLPVVELPPLRLLGCHLAAPLVAGGPLPPCDDSAMDGYAIRAASTAGARRDAPRRLALGDGAAAIATGDPLPAWADAVLPLEWARDEGSTISRSETNPGSIAAWREVEPGRNVRRRGEDLQAGDLVAPAGARIDTGIVLAAGMLGLERLSAHRRVRVAVLPVGHHFVAGRQDATGPAVVAAVRAWGALARLLPPAVGDAAAVRARIEAALQQVDLLITTGAASVGATDVVPAAVEALGARLLFHGVSIKPGKPIGVAQYAGRTLLLLPGSPTAALAGLEGIGRAVHARLAGDPLGLAPIAVELGGELRRGRGKTGLLRGNVAAVGGRLVFTQAPKQGPSQVAAVVGTNALALISPDIEFLERGAALPVLLLRGAGGVEAGDIGAVANEAEAVQEAGGMPASKLHAMRSIAVCGYSGAGKTWVVERLVERLSAAGIRVATVKHDGCGDEREPAGKDTARHAAAGAIATALVDAHGVVRRSAIASVDRIAGDLLAAGADLVIAEGFKSDRSIPKIEVAARGRERVHATPLLALVGSEIGEAGAGDAPSFTPDAAGMDLLAALVRAALAR